VPIETAGTARAAGAVPDAPTTIIGVAPVDRAGAVARSLVGSTMRTGADRVRGVAGVAGVAPGPPAVTAGAVPGRLVHATVILGPTPPPAVAEVVSADQGGVPGRGHPRRRADSGACDPHEESHGSLPPASANRRLWRTADWAWSTVVETGARRARSPLRSISPEEGDLRGRYRSVSRRPGAAAVARRRAAAPQTRQGVRQPN
jgi:hypothetical protein